MIETDSRDAALRISKEDFKRTGYFLIDRLADFFNTIDDYPVTPGETPNQIGW